ncbi:hypothetical protein L7F22_020251 [Adiantum nelumboides]|nr:hypothetical protein [Adiantum nelumboides]
MMGKQHRQPFPQEASKAKAPLELVHTDLCGKMNTTALGGSSYFMMLIDDYSRRTWVYFLKGKDEAFAKFKEWHDLVEKKTGNKLKKRRSDRGGEFTSSEFADYSKQHGLKSHLTTPHTPQQNGVAERKNRVIVEMARSMIEAKGLPNSFWAEAVNIAVYILNRSYTKAVKDMTPLQAFSGKKPSVSHFKIFGSDCYVHVPDASRTKWDAKSQKCIFLGYSEESKGYRVYNPTTKKIVISRDVVFAEQPHHEEEDEGSSFENQEIPTYQSQPPTADDLIIRGDALEDGEHVKALLHKQFDMKVLGELRYFLGIEMIHLEGGVWLLQKKYGLDVLMKYGMADCKPTLTPLD